MSLVSQHLLSVEGGDAGLAIWCWGGGGRRRCIDAIICGRGRSHLPGLDALLGALLATLGSGLLDGLRGHDGLLLSSLGSHCDVMYGINRR